MKDMKSKKFKIISYKEKYGESLEMICAKCGKPLGQHSIYYNCPNIDIEGNILSFHLVNKFSVKVCPKGVIMFEYIHK